MVEKSRFFDTKLVNGVKDRVYPASDYADYFATLVTNGVFGEQLNTLQVVGHGTNLQTIVRSGKAMINGYYYENTEDLVLNHDAETVGNNRIDRIVLRVNLDEEDPQGRDLKAYVIKGTPGTSPVAPALTRTATIYEVSLAQVTVVGGQGYIGVNDPVDERGDNNLCGYVKYQAKPAWYPQGEVPVDAWMYVAFKDQLTAQEIADIEANASLMSIINGTELFHNGRMGAGSGLDADLLDGKHGSFFSDAIQRNAYDIYDIWVEAYYQGWFGGPDATNVKGIFIEGAKYTTNMLIDANDSGGIFVQSYGNVKLRVGESSGTTGTIGASLSGTAQKLIQPFKIASGTSFKATGVKFVPYKSTTNTTVSLICEIFALDSNGYPTGSALASGSDTLGNISSGTHKTINFATPVTLNSNTYGYCIQYRLSGSITDAIYIYNHHGTNGASGAGLNGAKLYNGSSWSSQTDDIMSELLGESSSTSMGSFKSKTIALGFSPTQAKLWLTVTGSQWNVEISVDGGTSWQAMTYITSRTDRKIGTEYEFASDTLNHSGSNLVVRIKGGYGNTIHRFGVHLM